MFAVLLIFFSSPARSFCVYHPLSNSPFRNIGRNCNEWLETVANEEEENSARERERDTEGERERKKESD